MSEFKNKKNITTYHKIHQNPIHMMFAAVQSLVQCALFTGADFCYQRQTPSFDCDQLSSCVRASEPGPYHLISGVSCLCRHCFTFTGEFCTPGVMTGQSCYIPVQSIHVELYIFSEIWNIQLLSTALQLPVQLPILTKKGVRKSSIIIPVAVLSLQLFFHGV